jgi:hypothetical protein
MQNQNKLDEINTQGQQCPFLYFKNFDASEAKENEKNETNSNALR